MKTLTIQSIKAQSHPETKGLFWHGTTYFVSQLFEEAEPVFDEIVDKLKKTGGAEWTS